MEKAGLPTPRNARINAPEDVEPAGNHVGFPAVIKPVSGAARRGVPLCVARRRSGALLCVARSGAVFRYAWPAPSTLNGGRRAPCARGWRLQASRSPPAPHTHPGAASIGVIRVNSMEDLRAAYTRVVRDMSNARIVAGALVEGGDDEEGGGGGGNAGSWINIMLMLEEVGVCVGGGGGAGAWCGRSRPGSPAVRCGRSRARVQEPLTAPGASR